MSRQASKIYGEIDIENLLEKHPLIRVRATG